MHQALPDIDIAVRVTPKDFLDRMAAVAESLGDRNVERHFDAFGEAGFHAVNIRFLGESDHKDLGVQLLAWPETATRIQVEARAAEWRPDPPTRDAYCVAARTVVGPALAAYNRQQGTKYRMRVASAASGVPKLPPRSAELFQAFVDRAGREYLHPLDWRRFYRFVRESRVSIHEEALCEMLLNAGFPGPAASRLSSLYAHLVAFKRCCD